MPLIDLLDDTVDLTPARHVSATATDHLAEYAALRSELGQLDDLRRCCPHLAAGPGALDGATISVADLARAGLVDVRRTGDVVSASDQLDTDYLQGFLRSAANARRSTSASGTYRLDVRGSRIPQMGIDEQRRYGAAFRALDAFEDGMRKVAS